MKNLSNQTVLTAFKTAKSNDTKKLCCRYIVRDLINNPATSFKVSSVTNSPFLTDSLIEEIQFSPLQALAWLTNQKGKMLQMYIVLTAFDMGYVTRQAAESFIDNLPMAYIQKDILKLQDILLKNPAVAQIILTKAENSVRYCDRKALFRKFGFQLFSGLKYLAEDELFPNASAEEYSDTTVSLGQWLMRLFSLDLTTENFPNFVETIYRLSNQAFSSDRLEPAAKDYLTEVRLHILETLRKSNLTTVDMVLQKCLGTMDILTVDNYLELLTVIAGNTAVQKTNHNRITRELALFRRNLTEKAENKWNDTQFLVYMLPHWKNFAAYLEQVFQIVSDILLSNPETLKTNSDVWQKYLQVMETCFTNPTIAKYPACLKKLLDLLKEFPEEKETFERLIETFFKFSADFFKEGKDYEYIESYFHYFAWWSFSEYNPARKMMMRFYKEIADNIRFDLLDMDIISNLKNILNKLEIPIPEGLIAREKQFHEELKEEGEFQDRLMEFLKIK